MTLFKRINKTTTAKYAACLIVAGLLLSSLATVASRAEEYTEEDGVIQTIHNGFTYSYRELEKYKGSIEIVGVTVPEGGNTLAIPETLDAKTVISVDLDYGRISPEQEYVNEEKAVKKLILPKTVMPLKRSTPGSPKLIYLSSVLHQLEDIEVQSGSSYLKAEDGILYSADGSSLLCYPYKNRKTEYRMPSSVTSSPECIYNKYVKKIVFSDNAKFKSEVYVLSCENLESIYLPDNITTLQAGAFSNCGKLKTIRWSKNLKTIGDEAFRNCYSLTSVKLPGKVRTIDNRAFRWCHNLKKVTLPDSVSVVGWGVFSPGSSGQRAKIKKAPYLLSTKNKKIKKDYPTFDDGTRFYKYVAVLTATKNGKKSYYASYNVRELIPSAKKIKLNAGKTKKISITPQIYDEKKGEVVKKGWKLETDTLTFKSSNTKVANVTKDGKIKGVKKGNAVITVGIKTNDIKCRIKVNVR